MATETLSNTITALDASPAEVADPKVGLHGTREEADTIPWTPALAADTLRIARVRIDTRLSSIEMAFDDLGVGVTLDIGFYRTNAQGGAVVDANAIATVVDVATAAVAFAEYRYEVLNINTTGQTMWELAGLSARPEYAELDIVLTVNGFTSGLTGDVAWIIRTSD